MRFGWIASTFDGFLQVRLQFFVNLAIQAIAPSQGIRNS
jgi:hypothetical protein